MNYVYNDGGRAKAGYKGEAKDCVTRAIAIAATLSYQEVYDALATWPRRTHKKASPRDGVYTKTKWFREYMASLGFAYVPTMGIGTGCKVHLRAEELPAGCLIVQVSKHTCAVINGCVHDTYDPRRSGTRCVYGYWWRSPVHT